MLAGGSSGASACSLGFIPPIFDKPTLSQEVDWNVFTTWAEVDFDISISNNFSAFVKVRGYYQPDAFNDYGDANLFGVNNHGNEATYLSISMMTIWSTRHRCTWIMPKATLGAHRSATNYLGRSAIFSRS